MRIRTIKPEFFAHDALFDAEKETELPLRLAFIGLWCAADREGRFKWEPRRLGVSILPYDSIDFSRVLDALATRGFLVRYRIGDAWFGEIPSFRRHQIVNPRESASKIPEVSDADEVFDACSTRASRVATRDNLARGEGKGTWKGKGKEEEGEGVTGGDADASVFPALLNTPAFASAWADYLAYRRESKLKPLKPRSIAAKLDEMAAWGEPAAIAAIRESIRNGWQGVFAPKSPNAPVAGRPVVPTRTAAESARVAELLGYQPGL